MVFSFLTIFAVLFFARRIDRAMKVETIILTGIIVSSFLGALISLMIALTGEELRQIIGWIMGSVSMRGWAYIRIILPFFIIGSLLLMMNAKELNAMSFGEERAQHLGVNVQRRKMMVLVAGSIFNRRSRRGVRHHRLCRPRHPASDKAAVGARPYPPAAFVDADRRRLPDSCRPGRADGHLANRAADRRHYEHHRSACVCTHFAEKKK